MTRPNLNIEAMQELAAHYATLQKATSQAADTTHKAANSVLADNEGPGADAFKNAAVGLGSVGEHFLDLSAAAQRTSFAYRLGAESGGNAQLAMISLAKDRWDHFISQARSGADPKVLFQIILQTRTELLQLESMGTQGVDRAFSQLRLPSPISISAADKYGRVDEQIEKKWATLTDEQRIAALQKMADAYADANGFPRIKVDFEPLDEDPGSILWGSYSDGPPARLRLNSKHLNDPVMINTVIHEMQHRAQYRGMAFRWPWQDEKNGMTREEAERWKQLNSPAVRGKGGPDEWDSYRPRPIEVDARQSGRDYIDNLSYDEFLGYLQ